MLFPRCSYMFSSLILAICVTNVVTQDINITIPLNKTTIFGDKKLYGDFITLNRTSTLQINFNEISENLSFVIIQVHSHLYNVTLYKNIRLKNNLLRGTNIGLHSENSSMKTDKFFVENVQTVDLKLYIAVHGYFDYDPLPGGCNIEFPATNVTPILKTIYNSNYIYVDAAPARRPDDEDCNLRNETKLTFYMMYLPKQDFNPDVYFAGIIDMMSLKNLRNKKEIPQRMISAYTGTGAVFAAVANPVNNGIVNETSYSVYVPTVSYGCSPLLHDCKLSDINITIPLNKTIIFEDKKLYGEFFTLNRTSTLQINFNEIRENLSFVIIQVHSHLYNVTLYKNIRWKNSLVRGTNIGLHSENSAMKTDKFFVENVQAFDLKLYIAVHGYFDYDPIPGGCNSEFPPVPVTPFVTTKHNRNYIYVDAAPARKPGDYNEDCNFPEEIQLTFFMMYLPAQNFDSDVYFDGIIDMMSLKSLRNKKVIPRTEWFKYNRRMISAYTGTGAVFAVVVNPTYNGIVNETSYSVYVPTTTYGCWPLENDCELLENPLSQFACASLFFIGFFICFYGHRFFKTLTFFIGFLSGFLVTYILASLIKNEINTSAILTISAFSGMCAGAVRVVYWWIYGLPVFSIILSSADVGFIMSSLIFYSIPDSWAAPLSLNSDINFWSLFILTIALITIVLVLTSNVSNFICCAVIGAYATILPIDYYLSTHLKYVLIYIIRRATVNGFYKAVKMTIYQWKDGMLLTMWVCLSIGGFVYQKRKNRGRPPFPPPPRSVRAVPEEPASIAGPSGNSVNSVPYHINERTPLLS